MLWAKSLQTGDELDVCYGLRTCDWCIGTVKKVIKINYADKKPAAHILEIDYGVIDGKYQRNWFTVQNPTDLSKLAKLHTHTSCDQCLSLKKTHRKYPGHQIKCKKCELKIITTAIEEAKIDRLYYDIIKIISEYAIGFVINCGNTNNGCNNNIFINSESDFWRSKNKYTYYRIKDEYVDKYLIQQCNVAKVADGYKRFFCGVCKLMKCKATYCSRCDTEKICFNHPRCSTCLTRGDDPAKYSAKQDIHFCANYSICGNYFCNKLGCGSEAFCRMCMLSSERNDISKALTITINTYMIDLDAIVINIITEYSIGVIIKCNSPNCEEEIFISNKFEFEYLSRRKLIYYAPKQITLFNGNEITLLYGKKLRIFCIKCVDYGLVSPCQYIYKGNRGRCINMDCKSICGDHTICMECKIFTNNVCRNCKRFCCKKSQCNYKGHCKTCIVKNMTDEHKRCMQLKGKDVWKNNLIICQSCSKYCCRRKRCSVKGKCKKCNSNK